MAKETVETLHAPHGTPKQPRHTSVAIRHLVAQREKAIADRDKAEAQVKGLDAALLALGWPEK